MMPSHKKIAGTFNCKLLPARCSKVLDHMCVHVCTTILMLKCTLRIGDNKIQAPAGQCELVNIAVSVQSTYQMLHVLYL